MVIQQTERSRVLTINGGSSSLKFAIFPRNIPEPNRPLLSGRIERIGRDDARAVVTEPAGEVPESMAVNAPDLASAAGWLIDWMGQDVGWSAMAGIVHRVVHGGARLLPSRAHHGRVAGGTAPDQPDGSRSPAGRDRRDRAIPEPDARGASVRVLRHGLPSRHAARRADRADPASIPGVRREAIRLPRAVLRLPDGGPGAGRRAESGLRPGCPGPPRQRCQPGRRPRRPPDRYDHGPDAGRRPGHEHPVRRHRPGSPRLPRPRRGRHGRAIRRHDQSPVGPAGRLRDEPRHSRPPGRRRTTTSVPRRPSLCSSTASRKRSVPWPPLWGASRSSSSPAASARTHR